MTFINFIRKLFDWLFLLFSDSKFASTRRVIGVASFIVMVFIGIFAMFKTVVVLSLVEQVTEYLFVLIMTIVVGATVTDTFKFTKISKQEQQIEYSGNPTEPPIIEEENEKT